MKTLKYFTIKSYETIPTFLRRVKYETGHLDYSYISCSGVMGKGIQVLHLISKTNFNDEIKLEVNEEDMKDLKKQFELVSLNEKKPSKTLFSTSTEGLRDLW